jgi:hypothetical protein
MTEQEQTATISPLADAIDEHVQNIVKSRSDVPDKSLDTFDTVTLGAGLLASAIRIFEAGNNLRKSFKEDKDASKEKEETS